MTWDKLFERGYRINFNTKFLAWKSLFWFHNETYNAWSHLIGVFYFLYMMVVVLKTTDGNSGVARWPLFLQALCAIFLFACSSIYHIQCCVNKELNCLCRKFDYSAIAVLMAGISISPFYYGFYNEELLAYRSIWLISTSVCCFSALVVILAYEKASQVLKASLFFTASISSFGGFLHLAFWQDEYEFESKPWFTGYGIIAGGALIYALKFPEKYFKSTFDYLGASH